MTARTESEISAISGAAVGAAVGALVGSLFGVIGSAVGARQLFLDGGGFAGSSGGVPFALFQGLRHFTCT